MAGLGFNGEAATDFYFLVFTNEIRFLIASPKMPF